MKTERNSLSDSCNNQFGIWLKSRDPQQHHFLFLTLDLFLGREYFLSPLLYPGMLWRIWKWSQEKNIFFFLCFILVCCEWFGFGFVPGKRIFSFSFVVSQYVVKEHNEALKSPLGVQPTLLSFIIFFFLFVLLSVIINSNKFPEQ